jgi:hypothetical protein
MAGRENVGAADDVMADAHQSSHCKPGSWFCRSISVPAIFMTFLLLDFPHQYGLRFVSLPDSLLFSFIDAVLYTLILFITTRFDLARVTICYLALPYFIFFIGWFNIPAAAILLILLIAGLVRSLPAINSTAHDCITWSDILAFLAILIWVNLSGIGGYGYQWSDYTVNNARLLDLVANPWPIRYGENLNFVYYFGYFLPAALIGKITSINVAIRSLYPWAALGIMLAIRWLSVLTRWRLSVWLVLAFVLFGPLDIVNLVFIKLTTHETIHDIVDAFRNDDMDTLVFGTSMQLKHYLVKQQIPFFLGNFPGNSFQLYWSPQQLIAGWLCAALLMQLFLKQQYRYLLFLYSLLFLWAPMPLIALLPVAIIVLAYLLKAGHYRDLMSIENLLLAGSIAIAMGLFYLGGSVHTNPSFWLWEAVDLGQHWQLMLVFYLSAWGFYVLALLPFITTQSRQERVIFLALVFALLVLPLRIFGTWSDLLCRGSSPLMFLLLVFLLLVFLLRGIKTYWQNHQIWHAGLLGSLMLLGTASALLINHVSMNYYGQTALIRPLTTYTVEIFENMGPDDSLFNHLLRHELPQRKTLE